MIDEDSCKRVAFPVPPKLSARFAMRYPIMLLLTCFIIAGAAHARTSAFPPDVERLLALPEDQIDIGIAALTLAKEQYPNIDVAAYSRKLDELAEQTKRWVRGSNDPEVHIRALNTVLHRDGGFRYDRDSFYSRADFSHYFLNHILDTKKGMCYSMPLLYAAVAQRAGYPLRFVHVPDHFFLRYDRAGFRGSNVEATSGGKHIPDDDYIRRFKVSKRGMESGSYMRMITKRELLGEMVSMNAGIHSRRQNGPMTIVYLEKAAELAPKSADAQDRLVGAYSAMAKITRGEESKRYQDKAKRAERKAKDLGFVDPSLVQEPREIRGT